jgi:RNA polymerase sigma-70 factor (ECF subfamily)
MADEQTTVAVQRYLNALAGDAPADPIVRALLGRAVRRLEWLCSNLLYRSYPRLTAPPLNLQPDEMLGGVVERLLKAMRHVHPQTVRQFFALANRHIRWELNELARRFDKQPTSHQLHGGEVAAPASTGGDSTLSPIAGRIIKVINSMGEEEREIFELVRIQGLTHAEAANVVGISTKTVQRRLSRALFLLLEQLKDLRPSSDPPPAT